VLFTVFTASQHLAHAYRSSNGATSGSLDDQNRFCIQTRDAPLEHTAQSQDRDAEVLERCKRSSMPEAPKEAHAEKDVILVTSSGDPPESSRHVSVQLFYGLLFNHYPPQ
jgi:hypothetical protein